MENVPIGTKVGRVLATDDGDSLNYTITAGNTNDTFAISNNGLLITANTIDYEIISNYNLTVQVSDDKANTASNTITVEVIDLDDQVPSITSQSFTIMENVPIGTIVKEVDANDNDRITNYTIIAGNSNNAFTISKVGLLRTAGTIDYESISNYRLIIEVSDGAGNNASNTVAVTITDVAIAPKITTLNPSGVQAVDAILWGNLTNLGEDSDGNMRVSEYGFIYSTNASNQTSLVLGATGVEKTNLGSTNTMEQFSNRLTGLEEDTTYYYRAYGGNDIGTNLGEVRSFTTEVLYQTFSLSGTTDGEQSGVIYPGGGHIYNIPLSNTHAYNLSMDANSNILSNLVIYEGANTNEIYIQAGPFSFTAGNTAGGSHRVEIIFSGLDSGRRYLVLPLATTNHRLVISNSNMNAQDYTFTLGEETNTSGESTGRLLVDGTPISFFTNSPILYWFHLPPDRSLLDSSARGVISSAKCALSLANGTVNFHELYFGPSTNNFNAFQSIGDSALSGRYFVVLVYNNSTYDYTTCQLRFRVR